MPDAFNTQSGSKNRQTPRTPLNRKSFSTPSTQSRRSGLRNHTKCCGYKGFAFLKVHTATTDSLPRIFCVPAFERFRIKALPSSLSRSIALYQAITDDKGRIQAACQVFEAAGDVNGISYDAVLQPAFIADVADNDLAIVEANSDVHRALRPMPSARHSSFECRNHVHRARNAFARSAELASGVPKVAMSPSPIYLSSVPPLSKTAWPSRS